MNCIYLQCPLGKLTRSEIARLKIGATLQPAAKITVPPDAGPLQHVIQVSNLDLLHAAEQYVLRQQAQPEDEEIWNPRQADLATLFTGFFIAGASYAASGKLVPLLIWMLSDGLYRLDVYNASGIQTYGLPEQLSGPLRVIVDRPPARHDE